MRNNSSPRKPEFQGEKLNKFIQNITKSIDRSVENSYEFINSTTKLLEKEFNSKYGNLSKTDLKTMNTGDKTALRRMVQKRIKSISGNKYPEDFYKGKLVDTDHLRKEKHWMGSWRRSGVSLDGSAVQPRSSNFHLRTGYVSRRKGKVGRRGGSGKGRRVFESTGKKKNYSSFDRAIKSREDLVLLGSGGSSVIEGVVGLEGQGSGIGSGIGSKRRLRPIQGDIRVKRAEYEPGASFFRLMEKNSKADKLSTFEFFRKKGLIFCGKNPLKYYQKGDLDLEAALTCHRKTKREVYGNLAYHSFTKLKHIAKAACDAETETLIPRKQQTLENFQKTKKQLIHLTEKIQNERFYLENGDIEKTTELLGTLFTLMSTYPFEFGSIFSTLRNPVLELVLLNNMNLVDQINGLMRRFNSHILAENGLEIKLTPVYFGMPIRLSIGILIDFLKGLFTKISQIVSKAQEDVARKTKSLENAQKEVFELRKFYEAKIQEMENNAKIEARIMKKKLESTKEENRTMQMIVSKFNGTQISEKNITFKQLYNSLIEKDSLLNRFKKLNKMLAKQVRDLESQRNNFKVDFDVSEIRRMKERMICNDVKQENDELKEEVKKVMRFKEKRTNPKMVYLAEKFGLMDQNTRARFSSMGFGEQVVFVVKRFKEFIKEMLAMIESQETRQLQYLKMKLKHFVKE